MKRRVTIAALAVLVVATPSLAAAESPWPDAPGLVSEQLVTATLDAGGLPTEVTITTRVVVTDRPYGPIQVPMSTTDLAYVDRAGVPEVSGGDVVVSLGGDAETTAVFSATFARPLPVALHASYAIDGRVLDPAEVAGRPGLMRILYSVTNTVVEEWPITYDDSAGQPVTETVPVFAPFVGALRVTLPAGVDILESPGAVLGTDGAGRQVATWDLVLYPPLGDYLAELPLLVIGDDLDIPQVVMQVVPANGAQDLAVGFSQELLASTLEGNAALAEGLTELDEAAREVADGAQAAASGVSSVAAGTSTIDDEVAQGLVPGSQEVAQGAAQTATGQQGLETGIDGAYEGSVGLAEGAGAISEGAAELAVGLTELAGSEGLPASQEAAALLADAVADIVDIIGTPADPPIDFPPAEGTTPTLIQLLRGSTTSAGVLAADARMVAENLASLAQDLAVVAGRAQAAAATAEASADLVESVVITACGPAPTLTPAQCGALVRGIDLARESAEQARLAEGGAAGGAASAQDNAMASALVSGGLEVLAAILEGVTSALTAVSLALASGDPGAPGVYEGLVDLADGLGAAVSAVDDLAEGGDELAGGSADLASGTVDLESGIADLAEGSAELSDASRQVAEGSAAVAGGLGDTSEALGALDDGAQDAADGVSDLADGATSLVDEGTVTVLDDVIASGSQPSRAAAYLDRTLMQAGAAAPYAAPEGGVARVAYVSVLEPPAPSQSRTPALLALGLVVLACLAFLAVSRLRRKRSG